MDKKITHFKDWVQFVRRYHIDPTEHDTDVAHEVQIELESVPIIFVPGIMGSRICDTQHNHVWDPNYGVGLAWRFLSKDNAQRKQMVIDSETHVIDEDVLHTKTMSEDPKYQAGITKRIAGSGASATWDWVPSNESQATNRDAWNKRAGAMVTQQGWGQIADSFYTNLLLQLASRNTLGTGKRDRKTGKPASPGYAKIF